MRQNRSGLLQLSTTGAQSYARVTPSPATHTLCSRARITEKVVAGGRYRQATITSKMGNAGAKTENVYIQRTVKAVSAKFQAELDSHPANNKHEDGKVAFP